MKVQNTIPSSPHDPAASRATRCGPSLDSHFLETVAFLTTWALPVADHKATHDCRSLVQSWVSPSEAITLQQGAGPHTPHPAPQEPVEESQSLEPAVAATAHTPVTGLSHVTGRRHLSPFMRMCLSLGFKTRIPSLLSPPGDAEHG